MHGFMNVKFVSIFRAVVDACLYTQTRGFGYLDCSMWEEKEMWTKTKKIGNVQYNVQYYGTCA
jgi:hypothetical protein